VILRPTQRPRLDPFGEAVPPLYGFQQVASALSDIHQRRDRQYGTGYRPRMRASYQGGRCDSGSGRLQEIASVHRWLLNFSEALWPTL